MINNFNVSPKAAEKRLETLFNYQPEWHKKAEKMYDDIIILRYADFINTIAPKPINYYFENDEQQQRERDSWFYGGY